MLHQNAYIYARIYPMQIFTVASHPEQLSVFTSKRNTINNIKKDHASVKEQILQCLLA